MLKKIIFHGKLKELLPEPVEIEAGSAIEAMRGLVMRYPHLRKVTNFDDRPTCQIVGCNTHQSLTERNEEMTELHVVPAMFGAGFSWGNIAKIVIGAILIVVGILLIPHTAAGSSFLISIGASLVLGGVAGLLTPTPPRDTGLSAQADPEASKYLGQGQNTTRIGTRIAMGYGKDRVYGHFLSFDIQAKDVGDAPPPAGTSVVTGAVFDLFTAPGVETYVHHD